VKGKAGEDGERERDARHDTAGRQGNIMGRLRDRAARVLVVVD